MKDATTAPETRADVPRAVDAPRNILLTLVMSAGFATCPVSAELPKPPVLENLERIVEASPPPKQPWVRARKGRLLQINEVLAAKNLSWGLVRLSRDRSLHVRANSELRILRSQVENENLGLELQNGEIYLHSRQGWLGSLFRTPAGEVRPRSTQFRVRVEEDGTTTVTMIEGSAEVLNEHGRVDLKRNEEALMKPGQAPVKTAVINAMNSVQWCLYYPAVIHLPEIGLSAAEQKRLRQSIDAYRTGDLVNALSAWPTGYVPRSAPTRIFRAMLVLAVGEVDLAGSTLALVPEGAPGRRAIYELIDAVTFTPDRDAEIELRVSLEVLDHTAPPLSAQPATAGEWLARSYYHQSRGGEGALTRAREAALLAQAAAPEFGFAAVRVAELEFSFGRTAAALRALEEGMQRTPRNAQGWALRGFLFSALNQIREALAAFETAIEIDGALGNAWLGSGLCKIRLGQEDEGRRDLQIALTLEPNRALLHSYLGKASSQLGLSEAGRKDLAFAKQLDPNDPTPWLYSAVDQQRRNQPNLAIVDLEESIRLNDNRRLYRSQFLLDQDQAMRSANLASIYQKAGMTELAVREATRAVESDYTNSSAHLFLANSFDALRDPTRVALRYETPWFNELLLANLLSPVGGGPLSQFVSQQEYSKLFAADGLGGSILGEWRSDSNLRSTASLYGTHGNMSFGVDANYLEGNSGRGNSDFSLWEVYAQLKYQVTPDDIVYLLGKWQDQESGDNFQTYDHQPLSLDLKFEERQDPGLLLAGWNHRWAPGTHTLLLGGRLSAQQTLRDSDTDQLLIWRHNNELFPGFLRDNAGKDEFADPALQNASPRPGSLTADGHLHYPPELREAIAPFLGTGIVRQAVPGKGFDFATEREFEIYSMELQHIVQAPGNTLLLGGRIQGGELHSRATLRTKAATGGGGFSDPASDQNHTNDFLRTSIYGYDYWNPWPDLTLIGGLTWDRVDHPENFRNPPLDPGNRVDERLSAKAGFTYAPSRSFTLRGAFLQGLGGVTFDESVRLEPAQVAGFNQAYRTVISESLVGSVEAPEFTTWGLSMEGTLSSRTWWGMAVNIIEQDVDRTIGAFTGYFADLDIFGRRPAYFPHGTPERLEYDEQSFNVTLNQLVGDQFSVGARYRVTHSELHRNLPGLEGFLPQADFEDEATLHELSLFTGWNSPLGLFAHLEANWYWQSLDDDPKGLAPGAPPRDGDDFTHLNARFGFRFDDNQAEISAGILNILDQDYRLSPLNPYLDLPRERSFVLSCRWSF